jgi:hypothetical protein
MEKVWFGMRGKRRILNAEGAKDSQRAQKEYQINYAEINSKFNTY